MRLKPVYMWTPNAPAKLYTRHTIEKPLDFTDHEIRTEVNKYIKHKTFNWVEDSETQEEEVQPMAGLDSGTYSFSIRTNSLDDILQGDVVWLRNSVFPDGEFFIVADPVRQTKTHTPNERKMFKYLGLRKLL